MESHSLDKFLHPKAQFGNEKYKAQVESMLFNKENQEIIKQTISIFNQHKSSQTFLKNKNLDSNHINSYICQTLIPKSLLFEFSQQSDDKLKCSFQTSYKIIFDDTSNMIEFIKSLISQFQSVEYQNLLTQNFTEIIKYQNIFLEFDLQETNLFLKKNNQDEKTEFLRQYIFHNLQFNKDFAKQLSEKNIQRSSVNNNNQNIMINMDELAKWNNYYKELIRILETQHCLKYDQIQISQYYDENKFIPYQLITDLFDKQRKLPKIEELQHLIRNNYFNYDQIIPIFAPLDPIQVLIFMIELLDWCEDIKAWDRRVTTYLENVTLSFSNIKELLSVQNDNSDINLEQIKNKIIEEILSSYEKQQDFIQIQDVNKIVSIDSYEGIIYEVSQNSIQFIIQAKQQDDCYFGEIFTHPNKQTSNKYTLIQQLIIDLEIKNRCTFKFNQKVFEQLKQFLESKNEMEKYYKLLIYKALDEIKGQCVQNKIQ